MEKPQIVSRLEQQLTEKGYDNIEANAVKFLQNAGVLDDNGNLTELGRERDAMTPEQRAIDRQAKKSKRPAWQYYYDHYTNEVKLRAPFRKHAKRRPRER